MKADQLVLLVARAEFAREQLRIAIHRGASHRVLDVLVAQRCAAVEELGEALRLLPTSPFAFSPPADRHVPHQRRNKKSDNAA